MKRKIAALLTLLCLFSAARAEILPPYGMGQIGYGAVVLCQSLTVRAAPSTSARAVKTLHAGDVFVTQEEKDGWRDCFLSENDGPAGWVSAEYIALDPAWYVTEKSTPVYAWNDTAANRVGLLDAKTRYPILKMQDGWVLIGLRGAAGWIYDPVHAVGDIGFAPDRLRGALRAELMIPDGSVRTLTDAAGIGWIGEHLADARAVTAVKCTFDAVLNLTLADGGTVSLTLATDGCPVYRTAGGGYYHFGPDTPGADAETAQAFWKLFGLDAEGLH